MKMTFKKSFTAECCGSQFVSNDEYESLKALIRHIRRHHPVVVKQLNKRARQAAMSQNGCGYYDDGKQKSGGWHDSQSTFREAWRMNALREMLNPF